RRRTPRVPLRTAARPSLPGSRSPGRPSAVLPSGPERAPPRGRRSRARCRVEVPAPVSTRMLAERSRGEQVAVLVAGLPAAQPSHPVAESAVAFLRGGAHAEGADVPVVGRGGGGLVRAGIHLGGHP